MEEIPQNKHQTCGSLQAGTLVSIIECSSTRNRLGFSSELSSDGRRRGATGEDVRTTVGYFLRLVQDLDTPGRERHAVLLLHLHSWLFAALTWKYFGLHMLLDMAGLQNIPKELEEAAMIDGANRWQSIWYVTVPLLGTTIRTSVYLSVLGSLTQFPLVWIMTRGGPVNSSEVMATYMYRYAFIRFQLGYGSAVALVMLVFCLIFSVTYLWLSRRPDPLSGI